MGSHTTGTQSGIEAQSRSGSEDKRYFIFFVAIFLKKLTKQVKKFVEKIKKAEGELSRVEVRGQKR